MIFQCTKSQGAKMLTKFSKIYSDKWVESVTDTFILPKIILQNVIA